ncbi:MAG: hypothetical protein JWO06_838 [Bacteroidota bacterium]|nr:hypothetical protein [Bacteroidota bacterium]
MTLEGQYEYYRCIQHDFNEAYKMINRYVADLYVLPKKLVENTGPALDKYITEYSFPQTEGRNTTPYTAVLEFISQLDEFTAGTYDLYKEHQNHNNKSKAYLKKVEELNEKCMGRIISEYAVDYIQLTPELTELHEGLKKIKVRADEMVERLERLELRWENVRIKVA